MTCLDILLSKYNTRKLSQLGLPVRERGNHYMIHSFTAKLLSDKMLSLDDFALLDTKKELLEYLGKKDLELFKQYLNTFENPEAEIMAGSLYQYIEPVQDYVLLNILSEKNIDELASKSQNSMWNGEHYTKTLYMLFRNGLMGFDRKKFNWRRQITPWYLSYNEIIFYASNVGRIDFSDIEKSSYHNAFSTYTYYVKYFMNWEGFIETVPLDFYGQFNYEDGKSLSMLDLMERYKLKPELLEIAKRRSIEQKEKAYNKKQKEEQDAADKADTEYKQIISLFAVEGIIVNKPTSEKWVSGDRYTVETIVDGVPHTMYVMKTSTILSRHKPYKQQVHEEAVDHFDMLQKYKDTVHAEFKKLQVTHGCTHVMEGGGMQMQAFFCNPNGYISIMYLGMKRENPIAKWDAHWQQKVSGSIDPFGPETFYSGFTEKTDIERNKK